MAALRDSAEANDLRTSARNASRETVYGKTAKEKTNRKRGSTGISVRDFQIAEQIDSLAEQRLWPRESSETKSGSGAATLPFAGRGRRIPQIFVRQFIRGGEDERLCFFAASFP